MADLHRSRWAPASSRLYNQITSTSTTGAAAAAAPIPFSKSHSAAASSNTNHKQSQPQHQTPAHRTFQQSMTSYSLSIRLLRRLKWKAQTLVFTHDRALHHVTENLIGGVNFGFEDASDVETMFRVDFFEFYALLERLVVGLLGVWGVVISASSTFNAEQGDGDEGGAKVGKLGFWDSTNGSVAGTTAKTSKGSSLIGDSKFFHGSQYHRFHANLLSALDADDNPLHGVLGIGDARAYLGIAKEFRNRWKDVDVDVVGGAAGEKRDFGDRGLRRYEALMQDLRLEAMLACLLDALHVGLGLAKVEMERLYAVAGGGGAGDWGMELDMQDGGAAAAAAAAAAEGPVEAMDDAMEWD